MTGWEKVWTCDHRRRPSKQQQARGAVGAVCGREATAVWCRVAGSGRAFIAVCAVHGGGFVPRFPDCYAHEGEVYFLRVPADDMEEWASARKARSVLAALNRIEYK
jgi:hypothetical protein